MSYLAKAWLAAVLLGVLFLAQPAFATSRNVKNSCANNGDGTSSSCAASPGGVGAFNTAAACAAAMTGGDTCVVFAGTYNESVTIPAGTGSGTYNVFTVNGSDTVIINSFTQNSHTKILGNCPVPSVQGTCGFSIQNQSSPNSAACVALASAVTDYFIVSNNLYACGASGAYMIKEPTGTFGYIRLNTFSYSCSTSGSPNVCTAMQINGDHHLIEGNDFSHISDGPYMFGQYNIMRNNTEHDIHTADCGSNSSNCHIDFSQHDSGSTTTKFLVFEGNSIINAVNDGGINNCNTPGSCTPAVHAGPLFQAEACSGNCQNAIIRFHVAAHIAGGGITDDAGVNPPPQQWINVKTYNNSWVDVLEGVTGAGNGVNGHAHGSSGGSNINEIYYFTTAQNQTNPYYCLDTACTGYTYGNTDAFCVNGVSPCTLFGHTYGSGAFTADPGNISSDPLFVGYSGNNFNLSGSSPAINAAAPLTTTTNSGSGSTSLTVADAGFFQDATGGLTGVQPDCLRLGSSTVACIAVAGINYSTNTITLASAATWSNSANVYLYSDSAGVTRLFNANGDMGAIPFSAGAPTNVPGRQKKL